MIKWPARLQQYFDEQGFAYAAGAGALRTQLQVGLPQSRPLVSDVVWTVAGTIKIPFREFSVLTEFYENQLKNGSLRFQKKDPVDESIVWMWRFTKPFIASGFGGDYLLIQMNLERIPATGITTAKPSISIYPSITVNEGEEVTINGTAMHADHLQWQEHGVDISGENGSSLYLGYVHHGMDGHTYTLVGTNSNGVTTSNVATLHVHKIAPVFTHPFTIPIEMMVGTPVQGYVMAPHFETGGDVDSYVLHGFPAGITIDAQGKLHGTPTTIMDHHPATVEAVNSVGNASSNTVMVNVVAHVPAPRFDHTLADLVAIRGEAFTRNVSPRFHLGGPVDSYTLQNAPAGMTIDEHGEISWPNPVKLDPPNLFSNPGFDTDITPANARVRGTAVWENGKLRATTNVDETNGISVSFGVPIDRDKTYILDFDLLEFIHVNPSSVLDVYLMGSGFEQNVIPDAQGHVHVEFSPVGLHVPIGHLNILQKNGTHIGDTFLIDNFKIVEKGALPQMTVTAHNLSGDAVSNGFGVAVTEPTP